jgi:acyl-homoserine lactone synthase
MYRDRKRVFVDMLKWDIPHEAELERDRYDAGPAEYLILHDSSRGEHVASLRLLRSDLPHLMSDTFNDLCVGGAPSDPHVREITRLCVAPRGNAADRRLARNRLVRSMVEYGLLTGIRGFTAVCEMRFLSEVLSAGWDCRPLGLPKVIGGRPVGALRIDIDPSTLARLNENWSCDPVPLQYLEIDPALAA